MIIWRWLKATGYLMVIVVLAGNAYVMTWLGLCPAHDGTLTALAAAARVVLLGYLPVGIALGMIEWRSRTHDDCAPRALPVIRWVASAIGYGALVDGAARLIVNL